MYTDGLLKVNIRIHLYISVPPPPPSLGISTAVSTQGVVATILGSASSTISIHGSVFEAGGSGGGGITGNSLGTTQGGVLYAGLTNTVDVDNSTFRQVTAVASGGGVYVNDSLATRISNSVFEQISVTVSGGVSACVF
jgi:hypothetical protein